MRYVTTVVELLRPYQWVKNGFVLAPLLFSGAFREPGAVAAALATAVLFALTSSLVYIFNDIQDIESDRHHSKKQHRPLPAGRISIVGAWQIFAALAVGIVLAGLATPGIGITVLATLAVYFAFNLAYSLGVKNLPVIEIFLVASGFILRVLAGGFAIDVTVSSWMLACTGLVALLLTVGKRRANLLEQQNGGRSRAVLDAYSIPFLDTVLAALSGATMVSYLLFSISDYGVEKYSQWILASAVFVGIGILRFLQLVMVNRSGDDPTILVARDKTMALTILAWLATFMGVMFATG